MSTTSELEPLHLESPEYLALPVQERREKAIEYGELIIASAAAARLQKQTEQERHQRLARLPVNSIL